MSIGVANMGETKVRVRYLVTNSHLVEAGAVFARINDGSGGFEILDLPKERWFKHPLGDDVAVVSLIPEHDLFPPTVLMSVPLAYGITVADLELGELGEGDECFFIGRFGDHEGRDRNKPTVRFGNVSSLDPDPVYQGPNRGIRQDSFLVEARSLSGYSGSPVFAYTSAITEVAEDGTTLMVRPVIEGRLFLLGINWGHSEPRAQIEDSAGNLAPDLYFRSNSGMMFVVPAWKIQELLSDEDVVAARTAQLDQTRRSLGL